MRLPPIPAHRHQLAEFLGDRMFLSRPQESKLRHEDDRSAEAEIAIESHRDVVSFFPAAPGYFDDVPPRNTHFADIVRDDQALRIDGNLLEAHVIPLDAHYNHYAHWSEEQQGAAAGKGNAVR
jgi:hypothetical protein